MSGSVGGECRSVGPGLAVTLDTLKPTLLPTMSVRGLFVLRWLHDARAAAAVRRVALLQPLFFTIVCGVAMIMESTVSAAKQLKQRSVEVRARDRTIEPTIASPGSFW